MSGIIKYFRISLKKEPELVLKDELVKVTKTVFTISPIRDTNDKFVSVNAPKKFLGLPQGEYITIRGAYQEYNVSKSTLRRWCKNKKIKAVQEKVGKKRWLINRNSLKHYIRENPNF